MGHSVSFKIGSSVGRERERERQRQKSRRDSKREKGQCKVALFKTHLFTHSTFKLALTAHARTKKKDMVTIIKIK